MITLDDIDDTLDDIRAGIEARLEQAQKCAAAIEQQLRTAYQQASLFEAELRAHDRAVGAMPRAGAVLEPVPAKRQRHDVRSIVLRNLRNLALLEGEGWSEGWIEESYLGREIAADGVNAKSLHSYLLRAVRAGEVERYGKSDRYRLPHKPAPDEFASAAPERDAAE